MRLSSKKNAAVEFCRRQLGKGWTFDTSHDYSETKEKWMCSQLVWAGYKNQGIDIEGGMGIGVLPHDITIYSPLTTHINFRGVPNPVGTLDLVTGENGKVRVGGWAFDHDNPTASVDIHVYIGGEAHSPDAAGFNMGPTNTLRPDVNDVYGISGNHGFSYTIDTNMRGWKPVYIYAINIGAGGNTIIGMKHVELLGAA